MTPGSNASLQLHSFWASEAVAALLALVGLIFLVVAFLQHAESLDGRPVSGLDPLELDAVADLGRPHVFKYRRYRSLDFRVIQHVILARLFLPGRQHFDERVLLVIRVLLRLQLADDLTGLWFVCLLVRRLLVFRSRRICSKDQEQENCSHFLPLYLSAAGSRTRMQSYVRSGPGNSNTLAQPLIISYGEHLALSDRAFSVVC